MHSNRLKSNLQTIRGSTEYQYTNKNRRFGSLRFLINKTEVFWLDNDNNRTSLSVSLSYEWGLKDFYLLSKKYCKEQLSFCDRGRRFFFEVLCARYTISRTDVNEWVENWILCQIILVTSIRDTSAEKKSFLYVHCFMYIYMYMHIYTHASREESRKSSKFYLPKKIIWMDVVDYIKIFILYSMM